MLDVFYTCDDYADRVYVYTMNYRNNFVRISLILGVLVSSIGAGDVELVLDAQRDEIVAQHDYVLMLFHPDPCTTEDCKTALHHASYFANSSYIPGLKVVRLVNSELQSKLSLGNRPRLIFFRKAVPILLDSSEIRLDDVVIWLEQNKEPISRQLDTSTFEHLTQAATGATTGDWFVLFQSYQCDHLLPIWESVGSHLRHRINIAVVNIEASPELKNRFRITKCPTIIFFRLGQMYMYELSTKELTSYLQFANGWYVNAPSFSVPSEPTPFFEIVMACCSDALTDNIVAWLKTIDAREFPYQSSFVIAVAFLLALVVGCFYCRKGHQPVTEASKRD